MTYSFSFLAKSFHRELWSVSRDVDGQIDVEKIILAYIHENNIPYKEGEKMSDIGYYDIDFIDEKFEFIITLLDSFHIFVPETIKGEFGFGPKPIFIVPYIERTKGIVDPLISFFDNELESKLQIHIK